MENLNRMLKELIQERDRLDEAIAALEAVRMPRRRGFASSPTKVYGAKRGAKGRISRAGRRRISLAQKRRWAKQRKHAKSVA